MMSGAVRRFLQSAATGCATVVNGLVAILVLALTIMLAASGAASAAAVYTSSSPGAWSYTVPAGVSRVTVYLRGGGGGAGG